MVSPPNMPRRFDLAVVIVSYNTVNLLRNCLAAIPDAVQSLTSEVWVVDNASSDGSAEMVASDFPSVNLIRSTENLGFNGGNNEALSHTDAHYVLLLNPDTEAQLGSLARLVEFLEHNPQAGACGPKLLNTDGSIQKNGCKAPTPLRDTLAVLGLSRFCAGWLERNFGYGRLDFNIDFEVEVVSGACIMFRREVMDQVGMLDTRFFMFYDEIDYCFRIRKAGWKIFYVADAVVTHHWMGSVKQHSQRMAMELQRSMIKYYAKTRDPVTATFMRCIGAIGMGKACALAFLVSVKGRLRKVGLVR